VTAQIVAAILALAGLAPQLASRPEGARARAETLAAMFVDAGAYAAVDPYLITALAWHESSFSEDSISHVGAIGLLQVHPAHWGREPLRMCIHYPQHCTFWLLRGGATALAHYTRKCGSELRGVHAYRHGRCGPVGNRARLVLRLRNAIRDGGVR
jgi:hypothetical protein